MTSRPESSPARRDLGTRDDAIRRRRCRFHGRAWSKNCGECQAILDAMSVAIQPTSVLPVVVAAAVIAWVSGAFALGWWLG